MDSGKARKIAEAMQEALGLIEKDFGIKFNVGNATYSPTNVRFKVEAAEVSTDGIVLNREADAYKQLQAMYSLPDLGTLFVSVGKQYKIVGIKPRSDKFPILATQVGNGRTYKFTIKAVGGKDPYASPVPPPRGLTAAEALAKM